MSLRMAIFAAMMLAAAAGAHADVVTDENAKAAAVASKAPATPIAVRAMAIVQVSVFEAVNAISRRYPPYRTRIPSAPSASVEAAVAAATRTALLTLMPAERSAIDADYRSVLAPLADGSAKTEGIAVGEQAAAAILALRADDGAVAGDTYRPCTLAGTYVPTPLPALPHWGKRKPWVMTSGDAFRPAPPPSLSSDIWSRDYNEVNALGAKDSTQRTVEQAAIALRKKIGELTVRSFPKASR